MSNELKDCPFCGSKPTIKHIGNDHTKTRAVEVKCSNVECRVARTDKAFRNDHAWLTAVAVEGWNRRAALAASGGNAAPELPEPLEIHWPTLNRQALGCGVEDRGLHDRYECAEYGWEDGVDRAIECVPEAIYDAEQMRGYGEACHAAGRNEFLSECIKKEKLNAASAPNAALVAAAQATMAWWSEHQYDTVSDGEGGEYNVFDSEPEFVKSARAALSAAGQEVGS